MSKVLPDPKSPKDSADYIYGERMAEYEDRQNFFLNEKVAVKKDDVKEDEDKNPDSQKGQAVQTGDQTPIMFWAFMLVASAVVIFRRRKRA